MVIYRNRLGGASVRFLQLPVFTNLSCKEVKIPAFYFNNSLKIKLNNGKNGNLAVK